MKRQWLIFALAGLSLCSSTIQAAPVPLGTAFTYQGRLLNGGIATNGSFDMQFSLFDALTGGAQIAATVTAAPVPVTNGLFTVQLDYGSSSFLGDARWLQIAVRTNGSVGPYTPLTPRQALTRFSPSTRAG